MSYNSHHLPPGARPLATSPNAAPRSGRTRSSSYVRFSDQVPEYYPPFQGTQAPPAIAQQTLPAVAPPAELLPLRPIPLPEVTPLLRPVALYPSEGSPPRGARRGSHGSVARPINPTAHNANYDSSAPTSDDATARGQSHGSVPARDQEGHVAAPRPRALPRIPAADSASSVAPARRQDAGAHPPADADLGAALAGLDITDSHVSRTPPRSRLPPPIPPAETRPDAHTRMTTPPKAERGGSPASGHSGHRSSGSADSFLFVKPQRLSSGTPPSSPEAPAKDDGKPALADVLRDFQTYAAWDLRAADAPPKSGRHLDGRAFTGGGRAELRLRFNPRWTLATRSADEEGGTAFSCTARRGDGAPLAVRDVLAAIGRKMYEDTRWLAADEPTGSWRYERAVEERPSRLGGREDGRRQKMVNVDWYARGEAALLGLTTTGKAGEVLVILGRPSPD
ncbi:uncharacterized protein BXZ73DRAFT_108274 [Epithele typhae]|uniref:uncharacterized protein n=1 Tax=Epithele typhae TaxID=378194 RepID=UPI0020088C59|nr:uncharacterized protein BXZ73DRAFT_108274 [Epithele typhae]KAH9911057.1 hypothetical protein BXZ73DRAFT_108274 [Epithele typhae]